ncbi:MAG: DUF1266 domain-containing protein [Lachnospiraceae bacterium]|uniref:DUF1266 domain-containing protein n=1 Tax=uncultured Acetatifactor sp. TaxID=1671927 RepID=UPI002626F249|nr:DUF1266 domain-containing protein [uncultured Acetatifactor sp.]MCI8789998.1 DUF1266 domain-containing protein [Lachnospiraceae bacterium]
MSDGLGEQNLENVTRPLEDAERWVIASYAMWSEYYSEGNWQYVAGSPVKEENAANMQLMLSRDWEIDDREDLLDTVMFLTALYEDEEDVDQEDIETGAWDLCRACQILGMGFVAGIIDREEMFGISMMVCGLMQFYYPSWMHLYSSYLNGYKEWRLGDGDEEDEEAQEDVEEREQIVRKLLVMPGGPCSIPWNLELPIEYEEDEEDEEDEE